MGFESNKDCIKKANFIEILEVKVGYIVNLINDCYMYVCLIMLNDIRTALLSGWDVAFFNQILTLKQLRVLVRSSKGSLLSKLLN